MRPISKYTLRSKVCRGFTLINSSGHSLLGNWSPLKTFLQFRANFSDMLEQLEVEGQETLIWNVNCSASHRNTTSLHM
jgi:hypothetical protein